MLFPPSGYIFPPCIQSPEKSLSVLISSFIDYTTVYSYMSYTLTYRYFTVHQRCPTNLKEYLRAQNGALNKSNELQLKQ